MNRTTAPVFGGLCVCSVGGRTWRQVPVPGNRPLGKREKKRKKQNSAHPQSVSSCLSFVWICICVCVHSRRIYYIPGPRRQLYYTTQLLMHFLLGPNSCDPPLFCPTLLLSLSCGMHFSRRRWVVHSYENVGPLIFFFFPFHSVQPSGGTVNMSQWMEWMNGIRLYSIRLGHGERGHIDESSTISSCTSRPPILVALLFFSLLLFDSFSPLVQLLQRFYHYLFGS
jgi:hypothetical protein